MKLTNKIYLSALQLQQTRDKYNITIMNLLKLNLKMNKMIYADDDFITNLMKYF